MIVSWVGYLLSYLVMFLGIYLMSNLDFFIKQADEVQKYHRQELEAFFEEVEARLERVEQESRMNRHQIRIRDASKEIGLKRASSDPELCSTRSMVSDPHSRIAVLHRKGTTVPREAIPFSGISGSPKKRTRRVHNRRISKSSEYSCSREISSVTSSPSSALSESMHEIKRHFLGPDNLSQSERIRKVATSLRRGSIESAGTTSVESCISSEVKDALHNGNSNTSDDNDVESPPIMMHFMASAVSILDSIDSLGEIESFGEGDDDQSQSSCGWQQRVDIELGNSFASIASSSYTC